MSTVGVIGLGYVGLPLAVAFAQEGCEVIALDIDPAKVKAINEGRSYIEDVPERGAPAGRGRIRASTDYALLSEADAVLICVPTPLTRNREPDLGPLMESARALAGVVRAGQLVVLESTTYPGTTRERVAPAARGERPRRRQGLSPGVLARARRPGPHRLHAAHDAEGDRRPDAGVRRPARRRAVRAGVRRARPCLHAGGGGADQAAGEHLPLGEHRPRQRARDADRQDGHRHLGGRGRRGEQAVWLHALRARARAWAGTACRSTRST